MYCICMYYATPLCVVCIVCVIHYIYIGHTLKNLQTQNVPPIHVRTIFCSFLLHCYVSKHCREQHCLTTDSSGLKRVQHKVKNMAALYVDT